jgi:hypothetical protein
MPQKLIRLTCESNDGVFNGLFDEDIRIKQNSEIAFQSLSLERTSSSFNVNNSNKQMDFGAKDIGSGIKTANIPVKLYQKADSDELMQGIQDNLNKAYDMQNQLRDMNVQWVAEIDEDEDKVLIGARPSPFFPMAVWDTTDNSPLYNTSTVLNAPEQAGVTGAETPAIGLNGMGRLAQTVNGALKECYMFGKDKFIQSSGSWRIRLGRITEGVTNRPAFTLGMVDAVGLKKLEDATIELTDLVYAIQVNQVSADAAQGGYSYINTKGSGAVTETNPFVKVEKADDIGTRATNDVLEIIIRNGVLQGLIHRDTGGLTTLPASTPIGVGVASGLYPVVFFHLANTADPVVSNTIDMIDCSLDPWAYGVSQLADDTWKRYVEDNQQLETKLSTLATVKQYDTGAALLPFETQFSFASYDIAEYLGYTNINLALTNPNTGVGADLFIPPDMALTDPITGDNYTRAQGFSLLAKNVFTGAVETDTYLVDTQTFMLDSYDSYGLLAQERNANAGGSRRNLLATIPVTEQEIPNSVNARISYEPSTLDYIAIKNRSDIITRQIRMRLLDARYGDIATAGMAAMTILIREPYKD